VVETEDVVSWWAGDRACGVDARADLPQVLRRVPRGLCTNPGSSAVRGFAPWDGVWLPRVVALPAGSLEQVSDRTVPEPDKRLACEKLVEIPVDVGALEPGPRPRRDG
jgi:hypothetical protein